MLTMEAAMEVRILHKQGVPIREIAERLGVSRNTVRRYVRSDDAPRYSPRPPRQGKLDPYTDWIRERLRSAVTSRHKSARGSRHIPARAAVAEKRPEGLLSEGHFAADFGVRSGFFFGAGPTFGSR
jgi:IS30 family transposase